MPRDELQNESIDFLVENESSQKFLSLKPGSGKTYCAINFVTKKKLTPIVIVDNNKILNQWKESFLKFTDLKDEDVFIITGSPTIRKLLKNVNNQYKVYLASIRTLKSYCSNGSDEDDDCDWSLLDNLFSKLGIGIKIFDEAHVEWRSIFYIDLYTNIKENIYLTATPTRSNPFEQVVYNNIFGSCDIFGNKFSKTTKDEKYIYYINYNWNSNPSDSDIINMKNAYGFDSNRYNDYIHDSEDTFGKFYEFLSEKILKPLIVKNNNSKIAITFNCNNMVQKVYDTIKSDEFFNNKSIGRFCGIIPLKDRQKELDCDIILTTIKGFNKGVDVTGLSMVINTVNISSAVLMEQLSGRLRNEEGIKKYFIQITDNGFPQFINNSRIRNSFMKKIMVKGWNL